MRWFASWDHRATAEALEWRVRRALMGEPRLRDVEAPRIRISASGAEAITLAGAMTSKPVATAGKSAARVARTRLPRTASTPPMIAAIGAVTLLGGIGLWAWRRGWLSCGRR